MRNTFARVITEIAQERNDICLLSGDIGNRMFDSFKEVAPDRFLNCGIAEANMMSMASGMALDGLFPVVYTITPFTTTRCLEQIKIGVCYHSVPVLIIGTGSGLSYSELGATHHSLEDIAILRAIPGIRILAPCDSLELEVAIRESIESRVPTYIRIGKKGEPDVHSDIRRLKIGKSSVIINGTDVVIICVGPIITEAIKASNELRSKGISVAVVNLGSIKPLDVDFLNELSHRLNHWIVLEEHSHIGGAGSAIAEWLCSSRLNQVRLTLLGSPDEFIHELGTQDFVRERLHLDAISIKHLIEKQLAEGGS